MARDALRTTSIKFSTFTNNLNFLYHSKHVNNDSKINLLMDKFNTLKI